MQSKNSSRSTAEDFSALRRSVVHPTSHHILADRGYSTVVGIYHVVSKGAYVTVRLNTGTLPLYTLGGKRFDLLKAVASVKEAGKVKAWSVTVMMNSEPIAGRVCVIRKTEEAIKLAQEKIKRAAVKKGKQLKPQTLEYAKYVILFTTFPAHQFSASDVLQWYRIR